MNMHLHHLRTVVAVLSLMTATVAHAQTPAPAPKSDADVSGGWDINFVTPQGSRAAQASFAQAGGKLTGTMSSEAGVASLEGTISEKAVAFAFSIDIQGNLLRIAMTGNVTGDAMAGTADLGEMGQIEWTGARAAKAPAVAAVAPQPVVDVTGEWQFTVQTGGGGGSPTFTFKQTGEDLTGMYKGNYGQAAVSGTVKGTAISFSYTMEVEGQAFSMAYSGTVEKDTMTGTIQVGEQGQGTFSAKRK